MYSCRFQCSTHMWLASYFSQAVWWEKMASMSAKRTQFSSPLHCSFPAVSIKSFIATMYGLIYSSHLSANQGLYLALFPWCQRVKRSRQNYLYKLFLFSLHWPCPSLPDLHWVVSLHHTSSEWLLLQYLDSAMSQNSIHNNVSLQWKLRCRYIL